MVRITRRDFLKYCSVAAGALGLSASTLMKVEKVLANYKRTNSGMDFGFSLHRLHNVIAEQRFLHHSG